MPCPKEILPQFLPNKEHHLSAARHTSSFLETFGSDPGNHLVPWRFVSGNNFSFWVWPCWADIILLGCYPEAASSTEESRADYNWDKMLCFSGNCSVYIAAGEILHCSLWLLLFWEQCKQRQVPKNWHCSFYVHNTCRVVFMKEML